MTLSWWICWMDLPGACGVKRPGMSSMVGDAHVTKMVDAPNYSSVFSAKEETEDYPVSQVGR